MSEKPKQHPQPPAPRPPITTIDMVRELAESLLTETSMGENARDLFEKALHDQKNKTKLFLSSLAAHKQRRHYKVLRAADILLDRLTREDYINVLSTVDPGEARQLLQLLLKLDQSDTEFYQDVLDTGPKADGEAEKTLNFYFGDNSGSPVLPENLQDSDKRRNFIKFVNELFTLLDRGPPTKPVSSSRVIDVTPKNGTDDHRE